VANVCAREMHLRIDYSAAAEAWEGSRLPAMMSVLRTENPWEPSTAVYADGRVVAYDKHAPRPEIRWIDYGLGGLEQTALDLAPAAPDRGLHAEAVHAGRPGPLLYR
jgi:hypothetical protein